jgi:hypothetical protein
MENDDLWLGERIPRLLQALRTAGLRVGTFRGHPESFGSWHIDVGPWWRRRRVLGDGKEQWVVVQSSTLPGSWKDLCVLRAIHGTAWIDSVIETLDNRKP